MNVFFTKHSALLFLISCEGTTIANVIRFGSIQEECRMLKIFAIYEAVIT